MGILTADQLHNGYFRNIGDFPDVPMNTTVSEYDGSGRARIACTQPAGRFTDREGRRINFLTGHPEAFHTLHFNSRVPKPFLMPSVPKIT